MPKEKILSSNGLDSQRDTFLSGTKHPDVLARTSSPEQIGDDEGVSIVNDYCRICLLLQPLRTRHCLECRQCVRRYDHHCPFIGKVWTELNLDWSS